MHSGLLTEMRAKWYCVMIMKKLTSSNRLFVHRVPKCPKMQLFVYKINKLFSRFLRQIVDFMLE